MVDVDAALKHMFEAGGSDLHIKVPSPPMQRINGVLAPIPNMDKVMPDDAMNVLKYITRDYPDKLSEFMEDGEVDFWAKPSAPEKTWEEQVEAKPDEDFVAYALAERFVKGQLVLHTKFGKGIVFDADATRVEILFQEGKKKLGHGQP